MHDTITLSLAAYLAVIAVAFTAGVCLSVGLMFVFAKPNKHQG